jgi:hypothetical protein
MIRSAACDPGSLTITSGSSIERSRALSRAWASKRAATISRSAGSHAWRYSSEKK